MSWLNRKPNASKPIKVIPKNIAQIYRDKMNILKGCIRKHKKNNKDYNWWANKENQK